MATYRWSSDSGARMSCRNLTIGIVALSVVAVVITLATRTVVGRPTKAPIAKYFMRGSTQCSSVRIWEASLELVR